MQNKIISILVLPFILTQALYGACSNNVTSIKKDEKAACDGFLFSKETAEKVTKVDMQYKLLIEEYELVLRQLTLYRNINSQYDAILQKEQLKTVIWQDKTEQYIKKYNEEQEKKQTNNWIYFGLGILTTIGAGYALGQVNKGK